ncbi:hydrogenase subunit MbhD domain-containing protein [Roseinatronobacter sp.]
MTLALDLALCALIVCVSLATVAGGGIFRAIIFFITYGLFLAIGWARLGAFDVALAEAAIGAGLTGVLLLAAHGRLRRMRTKAVVQRTGLNLPAALAATAMTGALGWAWFALPAPSVPDLSQSIAQTGVGNPVTAVLLNFRAWDTLLESIVLLAALLGVWMLAREEDWNTPLGPRYHALSGGVLVGFGRLLPPVGLIFGAYLVWAGAESVGGAFQGGTVLAAVGLVALMANVLPAPSISQAGLRIALVLGPGVFLCTGLLAAALGSDFLSIAPEVAKAMILTIEIALSISIAVTLALLVLGPPVDTQGAP